VISLYGKEICPNQMVLFRDQRELIPTGHRVSLSILKRKTDRTRAANLGLAVKVLPARKNRVIYFLSRRKYRGIQD
jgi:hypothetical protein